MDYVDSYSDQGKSSILFDDEDQILVSDSDVPEAETICTSGLAWNSTDCFESFSPLRNVWIDQPLMLSSDFTTTRKSGSDFVWLII